MLGTKKIHSRHICYNIQKHLKKLEDGKKVFFLKHFNSESETCIYSWFITHKVKYFKPFFHFNLDDHGLQLRKIKKWECLKVLECYVRSKKKKI